MLNNFQVSVVIPAFNSEEYITDTIQSVLNQSVDVLEIIVVDDGSSDFTLEKVRQFGPNVKLIEQPNSGPAAARNRGVGEASGTYVAFLDSDDIWLPNKLELQIQSLKKDSRCGWIYTDVCFLGGINDGKKDSYFTKKYEGDILPKIVQGNFIGTSSVVMTKALFNEAGGFDTSLRYVEDWEFWARVASISPVCFVDEPLVLYRVHPDSSSRKVRSTFKYYIQVVEKIYGELSKRKFFNVARTREYGSIQKAKSEVCSVCSYIAEEEGDKIFAMECAGRAFLYDPLSIQKSKRLAKCVIKLLIPS